MIDPARRAALELLISVRRDDSYANLLWPRLLERFDLNGRDAAFATDLAYGTLRWQGFYDEVASRCSSRAWSDVDPDIADIIRLGIHQLLSMRVPDHAAVDSSCELARSLDISDKGRVGFINGVLRSVSKKDRDEWESAVQEDTNAKGAGTDDAVAAVTSHPRWITEALHESLSLHEGSDITTEALRGALFANNQPSRPMLAFLNDETDTTNSDDASAGLTPGRWSRRAASVDSGQPGEVLAVREGKAIVQDEGSQLVVQALLDAPVDPPESAWLDMCAGPGGKAAVMAAQAKSRGVEFLAVELHQHRAGLIASLLGSDSRATVMTADARDRPWGSLFFDRVLLDAPCTGLGALRRRPEARWRRSPKDVPELTALQRQLLDVGLSSLRSGGVLGYVTCSPVLAETVDVVEEVLLRHDDVEVIDAREYLPQVPDLGPGPHVQLWPHLHGTDAMHLTLMRRR
jgi:16S rRNA (cytosine967-C5)-methyltransferase